MEDAFLVKAKHVWRLKTIKSNKKQYSPFSWIRFNCLEATETLREDTLLLATKSQGVPSTHLNCDDFGPSGFGSKTTKLRIRRPNHYPFPSVLMPLSENVNSMKVTN